MCLMWTQASGTACPPGQSVGLRLSCACMPACACVGASVCVGACARECMRVCTCVCVCVRARACTCVCARACVYVCAHVRVRACVCMRASTAGVYACTCLQVLACLRICACLVVLMIFGAPGMLCLGSWYVLLTALQGSTRDVFVLCLCLDAQGRI